MTVEVPFELQLLTDAHNYQRWVIDSILPYLGENILELGAGIGNMSRHLPLKKALYLTEANAAFIPELNKVKNDIFKNSNSCHVDLIDLNTNWVEQYRDHTIDTIISFNVLEHIQNHEKTLNDCHRILQFNKNSTAKRIITFAPAHQWLMGTLDREFLHYRRYSLNDFKRMKDKLFSDAEFDGRYFNLFGVPGWFLMGKILRKKTIGLGAVKSFEALCPNIRNFDDFIHKRLRLPIGQSVVAIYTFNSSATDKRH